MVAAKLQRELERTIEELRAYNQIGKLLTSTLDIGEVLERVMQTVGALLQPKNWSLLLGDETTKQLVFEVAVGPGAESLKGLRISAEEGIAGWVASKAEPLLVEDVSKDPRFSARFDDATLFTTRSIVAVPMIIKGKTVGVIELVNGPDQGSFGESDVRILESIAGFAAIALENARNFQRIEELTVVDEHTGLFNTRHLRRVLPPEVERARRYGHPLSLIFFDLDRFKQINDRHGHQAGSAILRECGQVLRDTLRAIDIPIRYGGDEFVCLLPETSREQALICGERVRQALKSRRFLADQGLSIEITASFGIASYPENGTSGEELLRAADKAMYVVKAESRDGVRAA